MAKKSDNRQKDIETLAREYVSSKKELQEFTKAKDGPVEYKWEIILREILKKKNTGSYENKEKVITINKRIRDYVEEFFSVYVE
jgi:hypothetical protein